MENANLHHLFIFRGRRARRLRAIVGVRVAAEVFDRARVHNRYTRARKTKRMWLSTRIIDIWKRRANGKKLGVDTRENSESIRSGTVIAVFPVEIDFFGFAIDCLCFVGQGCFWWGDGFFCSLKSKLFSWEGKQCPGPARGYLASQAKI